MSSLVDYASESDSDPDWGQGISLPKLPDEFLDLYQVNPRFGDHPVFHQGRVRSESHETGLWPTHVYIDFIPKTQMYRILQRVVRSATTFDPRYVTLLQSDLGNLKELHVSLTKPIMLKNDEKESFLRDVSRVKVEPFVLKFGDISMFTNDEHTRTFLVMGVNEECSALTNLSQKVDIVVRKHNRRVLSDVIVRLFGDRLIMKAPQFHVSIAWKPSSAIDAQKQFKIEESISQELSSLQIEVDCFKLKIGKDIVAVPLLHRQSQFEGVA